ncbi:fimbrial protein [Enterobacter cloacae]|nr:fimbrial protein [Enterobacter cloacae]
MKRNILAIAIIASASFSMSNAFADGGTINFSGEILDTACQVDGSSQDMNVDLGKYSKTELNGVGKKGVAKQFNITLKQCPEAASSAQIRFEGTNDKTDSSLLATTGTAQGVAISLMGADMKPLPLNIDSPEYNLVDNADNVLNFYAQYQATSDTVTAGTASAVANFSVIYK